jgi:hypothetical protein
VSDGFDELFDGPDPPHHITTWLDPLRKRYGWWDGRVQDWVWRNGEWVATDD